MDEKLSLVFHVFGIVFCVGAAYLSCKVDVDAGEWFGILGVYFLAKGDYHALKEDNDD